MAAEDFNTLGQILEYRLYSTLYAQQCINTFHYQVQAVTGLGVTAAEVGTALEATLWDDGFVTGLRHITSTGLTGVFAGIQNIYPVRYVPHNRVMTNPAGIVSSTALPPTNTLVIRRKTIRSGRKYRGRIYLPGVPTSYVTGGTINGTGAAAIPVAITPLADVVAVTGGSGTAEFQPVVFNLRAPTRATDIVTIEWDATLRVQRRREVGRGI